MGVALSRRRYASTPLGPRQLKPVEPKPDALREPLERDKMSTVDVVVVAVFKID